MVKIFKYLPCAMQIDVGIPSNFEYKFDLIQWSIQPGINKH